MVQISKAFPVQKKLDRIVIMQTVPNWGCLLQFKNEPFFYFIIDYLSINRKFYNQSHREL